MHPTFCALRLHLLPLIDEEQRANGSRLWMSVILSVSFLWGRSELTTIPFVLLTAGDEQVKLWEMNQHSLRELAILESSSDAVLALAGRDNTLFAGHQGGVIKVSLPSIRPSRAAAPDETPASIHRRFGISTP